MINRISSTEKSSWSKIPALDKRINLRLPLCSEIKHTKSGDKHIVNLRVFKLDIVTALCILFQQVRVRVNSPLFLSNQATMVQEQKSLPSFR